MYGESPPDDTDEDSELEPELKEQMEIATPNTKRRLMSEYEEK